LGATETANDTKALAPASWPEHWRVERHAVLGSTQDLARERAEARDPGRLAVLAARQESGRGRGGRIWSSPEGNLAVTFLLRPRLAARNMGLVGIACGVVLAEATSMRSMGPVRLKWPNDVMVGQAKLGGVLVEAAIEGESVAWLALGFGVNLAVAPALPEGKKTVSVGQLGGRASPEWLAARLADGLDRWIGRLERGEMDRIRDAWLEWGPAPESEIRLSDGREGRFGGLGPMGELRLHTLGGSVLCTAGEPLG